MTAANAVELPRTLTPLQFHDALEGAAKELHVLRDVIPPMSRRSVDRLEAKIRYLAVVAARLRPAADPPPNGARDPYGEPARDGYRRSADGAPANWKEKNRDGRRRCAGCRQWLPFDAYDVKNPDGTLLRSHCRACWKAYQRQRYVAANKRAIIVEVLAGDEIVGAECSCCRQPIEIGDRVVAELFRHVRCGS